MNEGLKIITALEKYDIAMETMLREMESTNEDKGNKKELVAVANKIVRNRAKVLHSRDEMQQAMKDVTLAAKKISSTDLW